MQGESMENIFTAILISFTLCVVLAPIILKIIKKFEANQTILHYIKSHKKKEGTPTMGGIIFILAIVLTSLILFNYDSSLATIVLAVTFGYGVLGFLDDFIKIKYKQNEGLKPYQKIIGQVSIATIISIFAYNSIFVGSSLIIPFTTAEINLSWFYIPFMIFVFLAVTNSVNLTDGLDGLASGVSLVYFVGFSFIFYLFIASQADINMSLILQSEYSNLLIVCGASIGALLAYLIFNSHPASVFMGDTGSMALGGLIASIAVVSKLALLIPILGVVFVASSISVSMQVLYYKKTKKRIFKMAPLHHHFEKSGMNETKIVAIYIIVTAVIAIISILATIMI
jgi:phospho-N-acetylmuramoyl-pentapeptide-transferase